jgi:hypothetical protein
MRCPNWPFPVRSCRSRLRVAHRRTEKADGPGSAQLVPDNGGRRTEGQRFKWIASARLDAGLVLTVASDRPESPHHPSALANAKRIKGSWVGV